MFYGYIRRSIIDTDVTFEKQKTLISDILKQEKFDITRSIDIDISKELFEDHNHAWAYDSSLPGKQALIEAVNAGDSVFIESIDKIAKDVRSFLDFVTTIINKKAILIILDSRIVAEQDFDPKQKTIIFDPNNPKSENPYRILSALAAAETAIAGERLVYGKSLNPGGKSGRKKALDDEKTEQLKKLVEAKVPQYEIAKKLGISQATASRYIADLFGDGRAPNPEYSEDPTKKRERVRTYLQKKKSKSDTAAGG